MGNSLNKRGRGRGLASGLSLALAFVTLCSAGSGHAAAEACQNDSIVLRGDWGQVRFSIEIADDPSERALGLMNRPYMPISSGMLFVFEQPQPISFWMRNTLISLDMLFMDAAGVVQHIHHRAVPLDETSIYGGENLTSVLEINGGLAKQLGIEVGSQVRHPSYARQHAAWPC